MEDEFDNFMDRVTEIESLVRDMSCSDLHVAERARIKADLLLRSDGVHSDLDGLHQEDRGAALRCQKDRTVINYRALEKMGRDTEQAEMSKEDFMAEVEKDAEKRAKDRRERKQRSDELMRSANEAFRSQRFEKALDLYNKAIDERKDSAVLYENRALTCLNLQLYERTVKDCDWALRLNEGSLKALLYKAKALHFLRDEAKSEECIRDAEDKHPQQKNFISEYQAMWKSCDGGI